MRIVVYRWIVSSLYTCSRSLTFELYIKSLEVTQYIIIITIINIL